MVSTGMRPATAVRSSLASGVNGVRSVCSPGAPRPTEPHRWSFCTFVVFQHGNALALRRMPRVPGQAPKKSACKDAGMASDTTGWTLFDTVPGSCALAGGPRGIPAVQLPQADAAATQARRLSTTGLLPKALRPPPAVAQAMQAVANLLAGRPYDFSRVVLGMGAVAPFRQCVCTLALRIPPGRTAALRCAGRGIGRAPHGAGRGAGAGEKSLCSHRALRPGAGRAGQTGRFFCTRRQRHEAAHARQRRLAPGFCRNCAMV